MKERLPLASVVVPTRNRARFLPSLLAALDAQTYPRLELVVVDDASDDATTDVLATWQGEGRLALHLDAPSGSYTARNRGWRAAKGEIVAFTDDDCLPQPGWISGLVAALQMPDAIGAQGTTLARPGEVTPFTHQIEQRRPGPPYRTCNVAYRRFVLEQLGGFDDSLRWYADNIFGLRARRLGRIAFAPEAVVHHPPRPREWRDREAWLARFRADARHRQELRRLGAEPVGVPGGMLPVVLWVLRPLVKQARAHLRYFLRHPAAYLGQIGPMLGEKREMLRALRDYWRPLTPRDPSSPNPFSLKRRRGMSLTPPLPQGERGPGGEGALPPLPDHPLVSIVVVTHGRPELLESLLGALRRQTWSYHEVIVVDHRGDEETQALACAHGARLISANGRTLAGARQAGIEAARGEIVAFTDDDCLPRPDWIEMLVAAFRRDPALYGVQGRTEAEVGPVGSHAVRVSKPDPLFQTCNIAYRHEALDLAGGFDLQFGGWFEDTALGARVLAHGAIGFEPEAVVVHQAVLRRPFDRARWRSLLKDERRLARKYGWFYRRTRGPGFFPTIIARWLLGSPLKTLVRELPRSQGDPRGYLRLLRALLRERWELVLALWDMSRPSPPSPLSPISGEGEDDVLPSPALRERGRG